MDIYYRKKLHLHFQAWDPWANVQRSLKKCRRDVENRRGGLYLNRISNIITFSTKVTWVSNFVSLRHIQVAFSFMGSNTLHSFTLGASAWLLYHIARILLDCDFKLKLMRYLTNMNSHQGAQVLVPSTFENKFRWTLQGSFEYLQ